MGSGVTDLSFDSSSYSPTKDEWLEKRYTPKAQDRPFIAWDGEGQNLDGPDLPQAYTLFGCSTGQYIQSDTHLHTFELLDFIVDVGRANPHAFHIGFAFNYDSNMLVRSLSRDNIERLHTNGQLSLSPKTSGYRYYIRFTPGKFFSVTRYERDYDRKSNPRAKVTVKIEDIFSFFGTSFIKAYEDLVGPVPTVIREGKANRGNFESMGADYIKTYWLKEIDMLRELADELRKRMYGANLRIRNWYGPGALASYANKTHHIKRAMAVTPDAVREASRFAYAGGRFERVLLGRIRGPIYSVDINSAYPHAIRQLPDLSVGEWTRVESPTRIAKFGVYHIRLIPHPSDGPFPLRPGPLFHRDKMGNISFPWVLEGWYWNPEVKNLMEYLPKSRYEIIEGWEYHGWTKTPKPFAWVEDTYELRKVWKRQGNASQLALKLLLNSLYGKMAQRVGWNEATNSAPVWHQLEWAGWVTSYCRAMLWRAMQHAGPGGTIAVETDGLYTTVPPNIVLGHEYGLIDGTSEYRSSDELGGWEVDVYDEILYVQSGLAWLRKGDKWTCKRRGLDATTFGLKQCQDYLRQLKAGEQWPAYVGRTTRFIGMGAALQSSTPFKSNHCTWKTIDRDINPGTAGKRIHVYRNCAACNAGQSAFDMGHDMCIRSLAYFDPKSYPHDIPWENGDLGYLWRDWLDIGELVPEQLDV